MGALESCVLSFEGSDHRWVPFGTKHIRSRLAARYFKEMNDETSTCYGGHYGSERSIAGLHGRSASERKHEYGSHGASRTNIRIAVILHAWNGTGIHAADG